MQHFFSRLRGALFLLALPTAALAQTGVTIGASTAPDASAALDIISTTKGVLLPRVALATGVANPATGLIVFQTGVPAGYYYNAGTSTTPNWQQIATASGAAITASNGLTKTGQNVALGGTLTGATTITQANNNFNLTGGNVGIGTTTPNAKLEVGNGATSLQVRPGEYFDVPTLSFVANNNFTALEIPGVRTLNISDNLVVTGGNVGIGVIAPGAALDVVGTTRLRSLNAGGLVQADLSGNLTNAASLFPASGTALTPTLASTTTGLNNPLVAVSGTLAVVLNRGNNSLSLYDLSNPASPVLRGTLTDATNLANAVEVAISGTTAAVLCNTVNGNTGTGSGASGGNDIGLVRLFTLGTGAPVLVNTLIPPAALSAVNGGLAMSGTKLYVVYDRGASTGYFYVYDVTTPATTSSTPQGTGQGAGGGFTPQSLAAFGNFVAVGSLYTGASILNVSNPAAPVVAGSTGFASSPSGNDTPVALSSSALCVLNVTTGVLSTYNVSAAGVPTLRNTYTPSATPVSVALNGSLALVACRTSGANVLQVIDVSGSTAVLRTSVALDATTNNVALTPTLAVVANGPVSNSLQVFSTPFAPRTVTVAPDGSLSSGPSAAGTDYIQNQTASAQTGGFNISGAARSGSAFVGGAITGTGSSISGVGVGIRADGGLNLGQNTTGNSIYLGSAAGGGISGGSGRNTFLGFEAGLNGGTASNNNTFLGYRAGYNGSGGTFNIYLGGFSGYTNGGGSSNVFVGYNGGYHNTSGSKNTTLGDNSGPAPGSGSITNATALGADVYLTQSNTVVLGNAANVGIGTSTPTSRLEVNGGLTLTETASTALTGASPAYVIPTNVSTVRLVPDGTTPPTGTVALTSTTPVSGQQLAVYNGTTIPATLNSQTIPAGQAVSFVYSNAGWRASAGQGDNLGNHTATQALNLGGNALTGTGSSITGSGVGIRADGGLNLGQNGTNGSVYLGYQAGRLNTGNANVFTGFQSGFSNTNVSGVTGDNNQMTGYQSGYTNTTGSGNVFAGTGAGYTNTTGNNNQFSGYQSGYLNQTGNSNRFSGYQSGYNNTTGGNNIFTGFQSGFTNTAGGNNVFSGFQSGFSNTTITGVSGDNNAFTGFQSGYTNTTGSSNIFTGFESGKLNTTGGSNFFGGYQSGKANTTGGNNQFIGFQSGIANTTGANNLFSGFKSGNANTTADNNTFIGNSSGLVNTTGTSNIFNGYETGKANTTGSNNEFSGFQSGTANAGGSGNLFSGYKSGTANTSGDNNVFSGYQSGLANTAGANNVFIGNLSGQTNTTGGTNTALGYNSGPSTAALTNATAVGANAVVSLSNSLVLGGTGANAVSVGIGTATPNSTLQVNGSVAVGVFNGLAGNAGGGGTGTPLGNRGYVGLSPAGGADYYLLPVASSCPGRIYYLRNNSTTNTAYLGTGTGTDGGNIFEGGNQTAAVFPYFMLNSGLTKTVTVISDGVNWTLIKGGN